MGLMRKLFIVSTAGLAPIKAESHKERTAKATEKQVRLMEKQSQAARAAEANARADRYRPKI